jgi:hypothetical protein
MATEQLVVAEDRPADTAMVTPEETVLELAAKEMLAAQLADNIMQAAAAELVVLELVLHLLDTVAQVYRSQF